MNACRRKNFPRLALRSLQLLTALAAALAALSGRAQPVAEIPEFAAGIGYTNFRVAKEPWSVQVVRVDRSRPELQLRSTHARGQVMGMSTLSEQVRAASVWGKPLAGVNGDFYERSRAYAGDPRGLQIIEGDLISAPIGGVAFWIDEKGQPHSTNITSQFKVTWPNGESTPFGLNESRSTRALVLYTPTLGPSTKTSGGRELVLEKTGEGPWLPLRVGQTYKVRVREMREEGNTPMQPDVLVLSIGPTLATSLPKLEKRAVLTLSTATTPDLRGASTALSGGPLLRYRGERRSPPKPTGGNALSYEFRSMWDRHPRSAMGWNDKYYFLVQVDGRQPGLSMGMTLEELGDYMATKLGCTDVMNLDGGGSATFWVNGRIANSPCDGGERDVANALVVVRTAPAKAAANATR